LTLEAAPKFQLFGTASIDFAEKPDFLGGLSQGLFYRGRSSRANGVLEQARF
jgi:hypothetical protein